MEKITFEMYKKEVQKRFEIAKAEDKTGILENLSPALLRNFCLILFDRGMSPNDEYYFRNFFAASEDGNLRKAIEKFDTGKLKAIISFIKAEKSTTNPTRVEMAAIILNYNPRPYQNFQKKGVTGTIPESKNTLENVVSQSPINQEIESIVDYEEKNIIPNRRNWSKVILPASLVIILLVVSSYSIYQNFLKQKPCMQWQLDHFTLMDCDENAVDTGFSNQIIQTDPTVKDLRKIEINAKIRTENLWYSKQKDTVTFFNQHGNDPETGDALKSVTTYIRNKYHIKCKAKRYVAE